VSGNHPSAGHWGALQSAPRRLQAEPHLPPACHPDREAPLVAVPRLALPLEPACLAGRTGVLSARELRRPAAEAWELSRPVAEAQGVRQLAAEAQGERQLVAEAQGVRQLAAEAQGVRQLVAEARALQRAAQAWQAWPAQASAYFFRAGLARPRSPTPIPGAPAEPTTPESELLFQRATQSRSSYGVQCLQGRHDAWMSHAFNRDSPDDAPNLRKYSLIVALRQDSSEASSGARPLEARRLSQTAS
jgi:hypothetical protein